MEGLHRLFLLDSLLRHSSRPVPAERLCRELECSPATFKRLLRDLREIYDIPIRHCRKRGGYFYDDTDKVAIPGLWFTQSELHALLAMRQLLERSQPGLLDEHFRALGERVDRLLAASGQPVQQLADRLRIVPLAHQRLDGAVFEPVARATLQGWRLHIRYRDIHNQISQRTISPQRLVYYRDHWYLDAWCHLREALRIFWLAGIDAVDSLEESAIAVPGRTMDQHVEAGYGIFAGPAPYTAHLRFTGAAAMRLRGAEWHPQQRQCVNGDGSLDLWLPYGDSRELVMDILRYSPEVIVLAPAELKQQVVAQLQASLGLYE